MPLTFEQFQELRRRGLTPQQIAESEKRGQTDDDFDFSLGQTLKNVPSSTGRFLQDISQVVLHPIQTAKSLKDVTQGAINLLIPGEQVNEEKARAVGQFFKERYGGVENVQRTVQEDPVGFLADIASVLTGAGAAIRGAGAAGKISSVSKAGQAVQKAGLAAEPLNLLAKGTFVATRPVTKPLGALARESLGVTTGAGGNVIREAFKNPTPEFRQALRGQKTADNILTVAREGLDTLKEQRASAYANSLSKIKNANKPIKLEGFNSFINDKLNQFKVIKKSDGTLDFSKSPIADTAEQGRIADFTKTILEWEDNTAIGLDILKQRLDDFYTPSGKGRALTGSIRSELDSILKKNVKGYAKMTKDYSEATRLIKEIESTLSLKQGARVDTTIKKITSALRQNNEFRQALVEKIDELTKTDITSSLAGTALSPGVPSGLIGRSLFAGIATAGLGGATGLAAINPNILFGLLLSSPRVVGEFLSVLGMSKKAVDTLLEFAQSSIGKEILQAQFQAGRLTEEQ